MQIFFLLSNDTIAWAYRGKAGLTAYYAVRISNYLVFVLNYLIGFTILLYLEEPEFRNSRRILKCDKNKDAEAGWFKKMVFRGSIQTFEAEPSPVSTYKKPLPEQITFKEIQDDGSMPF